MFNYLEKHKKEYNKKELFLFLFKICQLNYFTHSMMIELIYTKY